MSTKSPVKVRSISASIGNKVIANAKHFFTNSKKVIFDEIFQNARRAQAKHVTITLRPTLNNFDLIIEDDGIGLDAESAGILLTFAGSENSEEIEINEQAAGIGFFALAHYDIEIASRDWTMTIPKEAFTGEKTATIIQGKTHTKGFRITMLAAEALGSPNRYGQFGANAVFETIRERLRFSGLRWRFQSPIKIDADSGAYPYLKLKTVMEDGVAWYESDVFLDSSDATLDSILTDIVETRHGVTVRVVRFSTTGSYSGRTINFFGKTIKQKYDHLEKIAVPIARTEPGASSPYSGFEETNVCVSVLIDVHDTSTLKLRLPDREAIIEDNGYALINDFVEELMMRSLAGEGLGASPLAGKNGIPQNWPNREVYRKSRPDLIIPAPSLALTHSCGEEWTDYSNAYYTVLADHSLVDKNGLIIPKEEVLLIETTDLILSLASENAVLPTFVDPASAYSIFGPKTPYRQCETALIHFANNGESETFDIDVVDYDKNAERFSSEPRYAAFENKLVDEIVIELKTLSPDGNDAGGIFIPLDAYAEGATYHNSAVLKKGISESRAVNALIDALHYYCEDSTQEYDSQLDDSRIDVTTQIRSILGVSDTCVADEIAKEMYQIFYRYRDTYFKTDRAFAINTDSEGVHINMVEKAA